MKLNKIAALVAIAAASGSAFATNGYFPEGYGMKALGMAGASTASASDSMGGANNPASMVWAGDRMDLGLSWFSPKREAVRAGSPVATFNSDQHSGSNNFYIPEFGYNKMLGWDMSVGVTVYGNGGMNTDFDIAGNDAGSCAGGAPTGVQRNMLCGTSRLGVDLMQLIVAPTFAMKINKNNSLGVSVLLGYQQFKATGLQGFAPNTASGTTNNLTDQGYDKSHGIGLRFGWLGKVSDTVTLGAAYAPKMKMSKFSKYSELFAGQGSFDLPENYNLGVSWQATQPLKLALDYQTINYGKLMSVGDPSNNAGTLGSTNGPGFGWSNVSVTKLGAEYQYNNDLTLRAGYSWGKNPIQARDVVFNILAPGVIKNHATLGLTANVGGGELTVAYVHAFKNSVSGAERNPPAGFGGTDTISMYQNSLGVSYGWKFK